MSDYCEDGEEYELSSILVHRGDAYSGHYHAYIKDKLREGNWNLDTTEEKFEDESEEEKPAKRKSRSK